MMKLSARKKYAPVLFFVGICLIQWLEEVIVTEGYLHDLLYNSHHIVLRSAIRITNLLVIFILGYIGLSYLQINWVKKAWVVWYIVVLIAAGLRMIPPLIFHVTPSADVLSFLSSFYASALSPVPYLFLWIFSTVIIPYSNKKGKTPLVL